MIQSLSNSQIKNLIQLQKKSKVRNEQGVFVIEGLKMFLEADKETIVKVYISESFHADITDKYNEYFMDCQIEVVSNTVFKEVSDTKTPQGIMAIVKQPNYGLDEIISKEYLNLLILEDIRDPGNLGTMVRTAEGAGITGIILSSTSVDIFNPKVIRSTMGSIYRMPFVYVDHLPQAIEELKKKDIVLFAAHLSGENDYDKEDYPKRCGLIIGNEAKGISPETTLLAQRLIKIPMAGKVESLNAAIAASILMYEIYRQRRS